MEAVGENGGGESWDPWQRLGDRRLRRGPPDDQSALLRENPAAESFSSPRFNSLGAASFIGQSQTLDGRSYPGLNGAADVDHSYPNRGLDAAFGRMCSLGPSAYEVPRQSDNSGMFYMMTPYNGLDGSPYMPMPFADEPYNIDGGFLINSSPLSRQGEEAVSQNLWSPTFSNSARSSPDYLTAANSAPSAHGLSSELSWESLSVGIVPMAMSQSGSRYLQALIDNLLSDYDVDLLLTEVLTRIGDLMVDASGNYVVQKLIERCSDDVVTVVFWALYLQAELYRVCQDTNGVRVMQKLLERVDPRNSLQVYKVTRCLAPYVVKLANNPNGQHVILHCLRHFPEMYNQDILITLANNCVEVAEDKSGCCVMQQCVERAPDSIKEFLLSEIIHNAVHLSTDCYGNYVVQHILGLMLPNVTAYLLLALQGNFQALSKSKYGSNVVEKCLKECNDLQANIIILELLQAPGSSSLFVDPYGNYVVQSALEVSKGQTRKSLILSILSNAQSMRSNLYGKKILVWLAKRKLIHR